MLTLAFTVFAGGKQEDATEDPPAKLKDPDAINDVEQLRSALHESNNLLEQAYSKIQEQEKEIKSLEDENQSLRVELVAASEALKESNVVLEEAFDQIEADQKEIEGLRENIERLINAGVEIQTPTWNVSLLAGYPAIAGGQIGFNFPFMPQLGVTAGALYSFEESTPYIISGVKLNIDID